MTKLERLTERIWIYPFEEERDRPTLGYIKGDHWSFAVDAGHSANHTADFYNAIDAANLPLPALTVLTHWHWDHTFGMHAVSGLTLANTKTNDHLRNIRDQILYEGREFFLSQDEKIRKEYTGNMPIIISMADILFNGEILVDPGNCPIHIFQAPSPHTDDASLIFIPNEKVLFPGDALYGKFPTWESDPELCRSLADILEKLDFNICVLSHHEPIAKDNVIKGLRSTGF